MVPVLTPGHIYRQNGKVSPECHRYRVLGMLLSRALPPGFTRGGILAETALQHASVQPASVSASIRARGLPEPACGPCFLALKVLRF